MMIKIGLRAFILCTLGVTLVISGRTFFFSSEEDEYLATVVIGVHHLGQDYLIPEFYINKYGGTGVQREGGGSGEMCCIMIPRRWRPGLLVEVRWRVEDWSHADRLEIEAGNYRSVKARAMYIAKVPVEKYSEVYSLYVHFFPNGQVRVLTTPFSVISPDHPVSYGPTEGGALATTGRPIAKMFTAAEEKQMDHRRNTWK